MQALWRLARSICLGRPSRLVLLSAAVCMSVILISAVACVMGSINASFTQQIDTQVGLAEVRVVAIKGSTMPASVADTVSTWDGVESVLPRLQQTQSLLATLPTAQPSDPENPTGPHSVQDQGYLTSVFVNGIDPSSEFDARPVQLITGRYPERDNEILIDARVAQRLSWTYTNDLAKPIASRMLDNPIAYMDSDPLFNGQSIESKAAADELNASVGVRVGDRVEFARLLRSNLELTVVGIAQAPPMGGRPMAYTTIATLDSMARKKGQITDLEVKLAEGVDPIDFVAVHENAYPGRAIVQTTGRITAGVEQNLASAQLGFMLITVITLISAAFIIATGLTTGVAEQQRMLGVLRCIGAHRRQLGIAQLLVGLTVSGFGALAGIPLGIMLAWILVQVFDQQLSAGLVIPELNLTLTLIGALGAGLIGALWPAWRAATLSPIQAMTQQSKPSKPAQIWKVTLIGFLGIALMAVIVLAGFRGQTFFWLYVTIGLPSMFFGYFLASAAVVVIVVKVIGVPISKLFKLPESLLTRTVRATPYRHGFTAGALMTGLALLIAIWTNGSAAMRDWINQIQFPDAFAYGLPMNEDAIQILNDLDVVEKTCAINMLAVETDAFGVTALQSYKTNYFGFEPQAFFDMVNVEFIQGDPETALSKLKEGGSVIVAREFLVAKGIGVGDTFTCRDVSGEEHAFEIVGVVTTPGLELVSQYFDLGESMVQQAVSSVFGSREDMIKHFGIREPMLIQMDLDDSVPPEEAIATIEQALVGSGVLNVGSGARIRQQIEAVFASSFVVVSTVALGAMLVACFGVANLIVAEVSARKYELGVLRAVGGSRGQIVRLICAQALIIGISACILGTLLGFQAAWGGQHINRAIVGIDMNFRPPPMLPIILSWTAALVLTLLAAAPSAVRLNRSSVRQLMSAPAS
ncbi:MAG: FtsX-like permease family protein [Phycisphaerales bacterium]|nr:FtsX-like permease family protein [Phycisphaerales bacterium]